MGGIFFCLFGTIANDLNAGGEGGDSHISRSPDERESVYHGACIIMSVLCLQQHESELFPGVPGLSKEDQLMAALTILCLEGLNTTSSEAYTNGKTDHAPWL